MKKLIVCFVVSLCSTISLAQKDEIVVKDVTMFPGGTAQMDIELNKPSKEYTAFQFELTLPEGISIPLLEKSNTLDASLNISVAPDHDLVVSQGEENSYYFIVFSRNNTVFVGDGTIATITLKASDDVKSGELKASTKAVLWATPEEETTEADGANAAVTVRNEVLIKISASGKSTLVSGKDLDFSAVKGLKAFIATGYYMPDDIANLDDRIICLTRVEDVPAGTPVLLISEDGGEFTVPITTSRTYYPANYLKGNAKTDIDVDPTGINLQLINGAFDYLSSKTYPAGSCYLELPSSVMSGSGPDLEFTMNESGMMGYVSKNDLDFTKVEGLNAYTVTGFDKGQTVFLTRVMYTAPDMPLVLIGTGGQQYKVPSFQSSMAYTYVNMLQGDAEKATSVTKTTADGFTNCIISNGLFEPLGEDNPSFPAGSVYLPVPTSYLTSASRAESDKVQMTTKEPEVLALKLKDGSVVTTGIKPVVRSQFPVDNDTWYNLNGQRVDTPSKGIFIRNGQKVVIR